MSSYLTINNVAYAAGALFIPSFYYLSKTKNPKMIDPLLAANTTVGVLGIAAVIIKEKSLQSAKWAIISSLGISALTGYFLPFENGNGMEKIIPYSFGFSVGLTAYSTVSLIVAAGKQIAPYITRR